MALVPDRSDAIRLQMGDAAPAITPQSSIQHDAPDAQDAPQFDDRGAIIRIEHGDGSVTASLDGRPINEVEGAAKPARWFANLVDHIDQQELARIADDLLRGVKEDLDSRQDWIEERAQGIRLLGLKIEIPSIQGAADGAPLEGMSKVRHPLLQEAVLRFQANARSEMLPTDGPVKIRNDNNTPDTAQDQRANALEKDLNHYLTATATEYYPDTDKMFLMLGFGGTAFKKVYFCPRRNRPVSETVDANDLIVDDGATDLANAKRVTHRIMMRPSLVKRMQLLGVYRDVELSAPLQPQTDAVQQEKQNQQGVIPTSSRPDDRDREIYECYCELDIPGFEHKKDGQPTGLEVPYRVTIDVSSKEILSIVRNYDEDSKELPEARETFVKYTFVPGLGFYDIGLLHILGNTTNATTAAWRELLDAGMFSNFPGFLMSDVGGRQLSNMVRVPPGGAAPIKTGGMPINQVIMPLPYNPPNPALMQLVDNMVQTGQRVGGTAEMQVGEGRADVPVGTMLAMIEQATKVLNSVHKRMHAAQAQEFRLLVKCFREHPDSFWQKNKKPAYEWDEQTFMQALEDYNFAPQADPNTASFAQRMMKFMALKQLQQQNPSLYDPIAIDRAIIVGGGLGNPDQLMAPPSAQAAPPPEMLQMQAEMQAKQSDSQAKLITAQAKATEAKAKAESLGAEAQGLAAGGEAQQVDTPVDKENAVTERIKAHAHLTVSQAKAQAELMNAQSRQKELEIQRAQTAFDDAHHGEEMQTKARETAINLAKELVMKRAEERREQQQDMQEHALKREDMAHQHAMQEREHIAGREDAVEDRKLKAKSAAKPKGKTNGRE